MPLASLGKGDLLGICRKYTVFTASWGHGQSYASIYQAWLLLLKAVM